MARRQLEVPIGAGRDHPEHPQLLETAYLKARFLRLGA